MNPPQLLRVLVIFQQGFVVAKYRPMTWWEQHDGVSVKATYGVQELLKLGVGRSPDTALRLVIVRSRSTSSTLLHLRVRLAHGQPRIPSSLMRRT